MAVLNSSPVIASRISLPDAGFNARNQIRALESELRQDDAAPAIQRFQSMIDEHGDELTDNGDGATISVRQLLINMTPPGDALRKRYDTAFAAVARRMLGGVLADPAHRPEDLLAVARRYPLASVAPQAIAAAANRAADQGDAASADLLFTMAARAGWQAPASQQARASAVHGISSAAAARSKKSRFGALGPLPFDATWFGAISAFAAAKFCPVGCGDFAFLASERSLLAFGGDGVVAWNAMPPKPWGSLATRFEPGMSGRGRVYVPAIFSDLNGDAQIVIVCQPRQKDTDGCLRAFRARDGKLLWSTETIAAFNSVAFLSPPTISGRYVFTVAAESAGSGNATIVLAALELTSGQPIWRCPVINVFEAIHAKDQWRNRELEDFWQQAPPAVVGDLVTIAPNVGAVFAVERFTGKLRWSRPYRPAAILVERMIDYNDGRIRGRDMIPPLSKTGFVRWTNATAATSGVVIAAPQDTDSILGIDISTAKLMWEKRGLPPATLVGVIEDSAIASGTEGVIAISSQSGEIKWTYAPPPGVRALGPAVVRDGRILISTSAGRAGISAQDGKAQMADDAPSFTRITASEPGKAALAGAGAITAFGPPPVVRDLGALRQWGGDPDAP